MLKSLILLILRLYQKTVSLGLPRVCRFYPTCSSYMIQSIEKYGVMRGLFLGFRRLARCHPFHPGGYDPVP